jgi:hypothetical protein
MKTAGRDDKGGGKKWNYKAKRQQRLGGKSGGLSLEAFAKAKSMPSGFNPSLISKHFFSRIYRCKIQIHALPSVFLVIGIVYLLSVIGRILTLIGLVYLCQCIVLLVSYQ